MFLIFLFLSLFYNETLSIIMNQAIYHLSAGWSSKNLSSRNLTAVCIWPKVCGLLCPHSFCVLLAWGCLWSLFPMKGNTHATVNNDILDSSVLAGPPRAQTSTFSNTFWMDWNGHCEPGHITQHQCWTSIRGKSLQPAWNWRCRGCWSSRLIPMDLSFRHNAESIGCLMLVALKSI